MSKDVEFEGMIDDHADEMKDVVVVSEDVITAPAEEIAVSDGEVSAPVEEAEVEEMAVSEVEVAAPTEQVEAPVDEVEAPIAEVEAPAEEVETPVAEEESPATEEAETPIADAEAPAEETETPAEEAAAPTPQPEPPTDPAKQKADFVDRLAIAVTQEASDATRNEVDTLKQSFYKLRRIETEAEKKAFMDAGGAEENFFLKPDPLEEKLKEHLATFRTKRAAWNAAVEKTREQNLLLKRHILEKLQELSESKDDFYEVYEEFRVLQQQWKEIKQVPQNVVTELWKEYQSYCERFYDLRKINNEMRDYDFKKNLELKQTLCETAERLEEHSDVVSAYYQMQKLHQEWREIGPVAPALRNKIWNRFDKASGVIYKRYQSHFEAQRDREQDNLAKKTDLCQAMEGIDYAALTSFSKWDKETKAVLERKTKWRTIGSVPKRDSNKLFDRFRVAGNLFFKKKNEYYAAAKAVMDENLAKKLLLCEKAEEMKDSQNWRETTDQFIELQREWRTIGPVPARENESIRKRFGSACDYFFEQKNARFHSQKSEEGDNLKKKKELIAQINALDPELPADKALAQLNEYMAEFHRTGFVPFRDKHKINKDFQTAMDKQYDRLNINDTDRLLQSFRSDLGDIGGDRSKNRILNERDRLLRSYEKLKSDIQTYENNFGFLSVSSKSGDGLIKEMQRKIDELKEELLLLEKKIEVIDQNIEP
jgi:hypothetical protein